MTRIGAGRIGIFGLLTVTGACVINGGSAPPAAPVAQQTPPPSAFSHPGFIYYGAQQAPITTPRMPPALSRRDAMNTAHLQQAAVQPSRCNVPKEVADGVFVHIDCFPYQRVAIAVKHATPLKIGLIRTHGARWIPIRSGAVRVGPAPTNIVRPHADLGTDPSAAFALEDDRVGQSSGALTADPALPDMVDHRLNGTEGPIKDQGDVGACTSFALSAVMDNALRRASLNITTSPEHIWAHYGVPTMEDAAEGNVNKGITTFDALPYSGKEACEIDKDSTDDCGETYGVLPNTLGADGALQNKLRGADAQGGHHLVSFQELDISPPSLDEMTALLASGADIWVGFNIDSSVWVNRRMQNFVIPDWSSPDGGHSFAISGYRKVNGGLQFLVHNSWGSSWGDGGYAWISQAMVQKWMHLAYKVVTDADPGTPSSPVPAQTDEDCPGDQVLDSVTNKCAGVCPDQSRPANGQCPNGPAPPPQALPLPFLPGFNGIQGIPAIPGFSIPGFTPAPAPATGASAAPASTAPAPFVIPSAWPWPVPSTLPNFLPPPAPPQK
ncbi:MAG: C1 family peptidase [Polyangiaceae bacterium]